MLPLWPIGNLRRERNGPCSGERDRRDRRRVELPKRPPAAALARCRQLPAVAVALDDAERLQVGEQIALDPHAASVRPPRAQSETPVKDLPLVRPKPCLAARAGRCGTSLGPSAEEGAAVSQANACGPILAQTSRHPLTQPCGPAPPEAHLQGALASLNHGGEPGTTRVRLSSSVPSWPFWTCPFKSRLLAMPESARKLPLAA